MTPIEIGTILDDAERATAAQAWLDREVKNREVVRDIRDKAVVGLRVAGWSQREVARHLGKSPGRIAQIDAEQGVETLKVATLGLRGNGSGYVRT